MARIRPAIFAAIILTFFCSAAFAQEDLTAPVLLDFTATPVVFDTSTNQVVIEFCVTGQDDLSGLSEARVTVRCPGGVSCFPLNDTRFVVASFDGSLEDTACTNFVFEQFSLFGTYTVHVNVQDIVGNDQTYGGGANLELCGIGPCELTNQALSNFPDTDGDGIPDIADNCPNDPNTDQSDVDLDLIGDACDPFPENPDNEQAQCDQDLTQALDETATCNQTLGTCQDNLSSSQTDLGVCQTDLGEKDTALTQALATIDAMRSCLSHYKKENGVRCRDGEDNDCDGLTDDDDPDCGNKRQK